MTRFHVQEMTLSLTDLPSQLDGMRVAHVTDTHVGKFTRARVLDEIVAATNRLEADLVLSLATSSTTPSSTCRKPS